MPPGRSAAEPDPAGQGPTLTEHEIEILKAAAAIFQEKGIPTGAGTERVPAPPARRKASGAARRRRPPADEALDREAEILAAAAHVFREKGFAATSIQDIADRVGILKGSIYYYIDGKEDLLYRIGRTVYEGLTARQAAAVVPHASPPDRIRAFIRAHVLYSTDHIEEVAAFFGDFRAVSGERRAEIVSWRDEYEGGFRALLHAGQADGSLRDVDVRLASLSVLSMMNSAHLWYQPDGRRAPREFADAVADLVISGLAARSD
ncbi:TetR/AcrR family transcriptional regulator [Actinomycetes bacterium KLBMP 9759]